MAEEPRAGLPSNNRGPITCADASLRSSTVGWQAGSLFCLALHQDMAIVQGVGYADRRQWCAGCCGRAFPRSEERTHGMPLEAASASPFVQ